MISVHTGAQFSTDTDSKIDQREEDEKVFNETNRDFGFDLKRSIGTPWRDLEMNQISVFLLGLLFSLYCQISFAACPADGTDVGDVEATVIGIDIGENCTYILIDAVTSDFSNHDTGGFVAGRFAYLAIDNEHSKYNAMLSIASLALATDTKVYARVTSRYARVDRLSLSQQENDNQ